MPDEKPKASDPNAPKETPQARKQAPTAASLLSPLVPKSRTAHLEQWKWKKGQSPKSPGNKASLAGKAKALVGGDGRLVLEYFARLVSGEEKAGHTIRVEAGKELLNRAFGKSVDIVAQLQVAADKVGLDIGVADNLLSEMLRGVSSQGQGVSSGVNSQLDLANSNGGQVFSSSVTVTEYQPDGGSVVTTQSVTRIDPADGGDTTGGVPGGELEIQGGPGVHKLNKDTPVKSSDAVIDVTPQESHQVKKEPGEK